MADKFVITGELELALASGITSKIEELKKKVSKSGITLPVDVDTSSVMKKLEKIKLSAPINLDIKGLQADVKTVLKEFNGVKNSIGKQGLVGNVNLNITGLQADIKTVLKEFNGLKNSISKNPIVGTVSLNITDLQSDIKTVYQELRALKTSLSKPILSAVGFDLVGLQNDVKTVYKEARQLKTSIAANPITLGINITNSADFQTFLATLKGVRSKSVSLGLNVKQKAIDKLQALTSSINTFNIALGAVDTAKIVSMSNSINDMGKGIAALNKFSGKKFSFDISLKDVKNTQALEVNLSAIARAFDRATTSATAFNSKLGLLSSFISTLKTNLSGLNFAPLVNGANALKKFASTNIASAQKNLTASVKEGTDAIYDLGVQSGLTLKRFGAYTLVTAGFFRLTYAIRNAVTEFIAFDKELTKVRQVTGQSRQLTEELGDEVGRLATLYGVSSQSILDTSLVLAQAGYNTTEVKKALEALTKTELAPTFENITDTTEATIAMMAQFGVTVDSLEEKLSGINAVSAAFAVESSDITTAIQKAGGGFAAAGGTLEELEALLTSVRATTRESADTISTGFRTIFTRIQRVGTGKYLETLGVNIRKTGEEAAKTGGRIGDFVGPFEAIKRLSAATSQLSTKDPRFAQIVEELGGFRQINKVIPLLQNQKLAQNALSVALGGTNSLTEDAEIAAESYANKLEKLKQEFLLFIRELADDKQIKGFITNMLSLATATLEVAKALKAVVPLAAVLGSIKLAGFAKSYLPGLKAGINAKNKGGIVPGDGPDRDSVLTYLTKGEYVLNKRATRNIGKNNLDQINRAQKLNSGGSVGGAAASSLAVGGVAFALSGSGLIDSFNELDSETQKLYSTMAGTIAQFFILKNIIKDLGFKGFSKSVAKDTVPGAAFIDQLNVRKDKPVTPEDKSSAKTISTAIANELKKLEKITNTGFNNREASKLSVNDLVKQLPKGLEKSLKDAGVTFNETDKISGVQNGIYKPSGKVRGVYNPVNKSVNVLNHSQYANDPQNLKDRRAKVFFHETGHAVDFTNKGGNLSASKDFQKSMETDLKNLTAEQKKKYSYYIQNGDKSKRKYASGELFAESFAQKHTNQDPEFQKAFPNVFKHVDSVTGATKQSEQIAASNRRLEKLSNLQQKGATQRIAEKFGIPTFNKVSLGAGSGAFGRGGDAYGVPPKPPKRPTGNFFGRKFPESFKGGADLSKLGSGLGLGAALVGGLAGESLKFISQPDQNGKGGSKTGVGIGGAISGAATGAALGSLFGPLGIAIGGLSGGIYGAVTALQEFDDKISTINISKLTTNLEDLFNNINNKKTTSGSSRSSVISSLTSFQNSLQNTSDKGTRENISASLKGNSLNIQNFVDDIAKGSTSIEDFSNKVNDKTLLFISSITGIDFDKYKESIKKTIEDQLKFDASMKNATTSINTFDDRVRSISRFNLAFEEAGRSVSNFSNNLESFAFNGGGSTTLRDNITPGLTGGASNNSDLTKRISEFANQFGESGKAIGDTVNDIVSIKSAIPDLLLQLRSQAPLAAEGDLEARFSTLLDNINVNGKKGPGTEISNLLNSRLESLLGADFKDSEFFKALEKDFPKAVSDLTAGLEAPVEAITKAYATAATKLTDFSSKLEKLRALDKLRTEGKLNINDLQGSKISSRQEFSGKNLLPQLLGNAQNRTKIATGGRSSGQLLQTVLSGRSNVNNLTAQLNSTEDIQQKAGLISSIEAERAAIDKATEALNYLTKNTSELSVIQAQLNKEQGARLAKKDIAKSLVFGDARERAQFGRVNSAANTLATTGSISSVPQDILKDVLSLLEQLGDSQIGSSGLTGKEVVDKTLKNSNGVLPTDFQNTADPSKQEQTLQSQIETQINSQIEAQKALNTLLAQDRKDLSTAIQEDFKFFLGELQALLAQGQAKETQNKLTSATGDLNTLTTQRNNLAGIQGKFGKNAINNAQEIKDTESTIAKFTAQPQNIENVQAKLKPVKAGLKGTFGLASSRATVSQINNATSDTLSALRPDQIQRVQTDLAKADLGKNNTDGTVNVNKVFDTIQSSLSALAKEASTSLSEANIKRSDLINNVGGLKNYGNISQNADQIISASANLPKDQNIQALNAEIANLTTKISELRSSLPANVPQIPIRRNSGGIVPGTGNSDSVHALLTPGEVVMNKAAVNKYGAGNLLRMNNVQKFASGGMVQPNAISIDGEGLSKFNFAVSQLAIQIANMKDAFAALPSSITMNGSFRLDVYINGTQAFASMTDSFRLLVESEINKGINNLLRKKFPNLGTFDART